MTSEKKVRGKFSWCERNTKERFWESPTTGLQRILNHGGSRRFSSETTVSFGEKKNLKT